MPRPEGAADDSPGQRPGGPSRRTQFKIQYTAHNQALKGRPNGVFDRGRTALGLAEQVVADPSNTPRLIGPSHRAMFVTTLPGPSC